MARRRGKRRLPRNRVSSEGWISLAAGGALALLVLASTCISFIFTPLLVIVHELGHTATGWIFGYPSLPAFDFTYGGGLTTSSGRATVVLIFIYIVFVVLLFACRHMRWGLVFLAALMLAYTLIAFTSVHKVIIVAMGHGAELIISTIFLYRAISGSAIVHSVERPLYAFSGFFIQFMDIRFAYRLVTSPYYQLEYEDAKGGGHWMDFSRLAEEFFHVRLSVVAVIFLAACFLPPLVGFLVYRYQSFFQALLNLLLDEGE
jgi:hypothetical protein